MTFLPVTSMIDTWKYVVRIHACMSYIQFLISIVSEFIYCPMIMPNHHVFDFLAQLISISEILAWYRKSYLTHAVT